MPLDLKFNIQTTNDCRTLIIEDITGNYSEENLGGWGGLNVEPDKSQVNIDIIIQIYFYEEELIISEGIFNLAVFENFINLQIEDSYKKFKLALPIETLKEEISELHNFEVVEDNLYQIVVRISDIQDINNEHAIKEFVFKNTCTTSKLVSSALTSVNLQCEDCDDTDLEKILLAKSLLESIENI